MLFALFFPLLSFAGLAAADLIADLHQADALIQQEYGPLPIKQDKFKLNLAALTSRYIEQAKSISEEERPYLLLRYVAEFSDSHFGAQTQGTKTATLGFGVDFVDGRVLVDSIDRAALDESIFPIQRGDELLTIDGNPVADVIRELSAYRGMGRPVTARNLAAYSLTDRKEGALPLPKGAAALRFRTGEGQVSITVPWKIASTSHNETPKAQVAAGDWCAEKSRIAPPKGATIVEGVPFTAFSFQTARGRIGFLRIPHFHPKDPISGEERSKERFQQYEEVIIRFERETVGLIIDQDYNCGGSVLFVNRVFSLFAQRPFEPARFRFRATETQAKSLREQLDKNLNHPASAQFRWVVEQIEESVRRNQPYTNAIPVDSFLEFPLDLPRTVEGILPNRSTYTKPVVMLVNEMSGSGGDVFPALMKDYGRATLFGATTMGAGGHTWEPPQLKLIHSGVKLSLTRSLIFRPNGKLIENEGVEPDQFYKISRDDFLNGYQHYLARATALLLKKLPL